MARQTHTALQALGAYGAYSANAADLTMTAASVANKEQVVFTGKEVIVAHNTAVGAQTITISSVADPYNRTGDIATYSLGAGEYAAFHMNNLAGWLQSDGKLYFEASDAGVLFGVLRLA